MDDNTAFKERGQRREQECPKPLETQWLTSILVTRPFTLPWGFPGWGPSVLLELPGSWQGLLSWFD